MTTVNDCEKVAVCQKQLYNRRIVLSTSNKRRLLPTGKASTQKCNFGVHPKTTGLLREIQNSSRRNK